MRSHVRLWRSPAQNMRQYWRLAKRCGLCMHPNQAILLQSVSYLGGSQGPTYTHTMATRTKMSETSKRPPPGQQPAPQRSPPPSHRAAGQNAPQLSEAQRKRAAAREYDAKRKSRAQKLQEPPKEEIVVMVDTELFVTTSRLGYQEKKEQNSKTVGFLPSGTRLAVRQRESVPTLPPVDRFQVAVPFSPDTLGWINADKGGKPTLEPVPEDPPALVEQMAPAPEAGAWSWLSGIGDVVAKLGASVAGSMALFRVFSHSGLDQSDAGLEAAFKEVWVKVRVRARVRVRVGVRLDRFQRVRSRRPTQHQTHTMPCMYPACRIYMRCALSIEGMTATERRMHCVCIVLAIQVDADGGGSISREELRGYVSLHLEF